MESNQLPTTIFTTEESDGFVKSSGSTETVKTSELSESSRDMFDEYKVMVDNFRERIVPNSVQQHHAQPTSMINAAAVGKNLNSTEVLSSLPSDISRDAEIWYPECRDCPCCHGFKNGCVCVSSNIELCRCVSGAIGVSGIPDEISTLTIGSHELWCQQSLSQCHSTELPFPMLRRRGSRRRGSRYRVYGNKKPKTPCRFFFSASGCRHGDACPFDHTTRE